MKPTRHITRSMTVLLASALTAVGISAPSVAQERKELPKRPSLVVGIVVEGLSMDYIDLLRPQMVDGGLRRLLEDGVAITNLDYGTALDGAAATATLFTGASPSVTGIGASTVYDATSRRAQSVLTDPAVIGNFTNETLSPSALKASTLADELRIDAGGLGYVYAIASEPEQAIILAGHAGNSGFWVNDATGKWATTTHYKDLPQAAQTRNRLQANEFRLDTMQWTPVIPVADLPDLPAYKKLYPFRHAFPRTMAHRYKEYKKSPMVNADITSMAADYLTSFSLGKREYTDMLNLGYTLQPYAYGREADVRPETMDAYLRLDRDLKRLFTIIEEKGPGMDHTMVFLAGTPVTNRTRRDDEKWGTPFGEFSSRKAVSLLNMYLMAIYGNGEWVSGYHNGQLYLNRQLAKDRNKDLDEIRSESARFLTRMSGVTNAWTINDVIDRRATDNPEATRRNTVVDTAGDVFVAIAPGWQEVDDDSDTDTPQTTLRAATTVAPAFILAPGIRKQTIDTPTDARVLAPTVAGILRIRSPNGAALPRLRF